MPPPELDLTLTSSPTACRMRELAQARLLKWWNLPLPPTQYEIEAQAYKMVPSGLKTGAVKAEHLMNLMRMQWPETIRFEKDGYPNDFAQRFVTAICQYRLVDALGCASAGKSSVAGAAAYTIWKMYPWETSVFISTTSGDAGESRAWGILKSLQKEDRYPAGHRIDSLRCITLEAEAGERDYRDSVKAVLIRPGQEGQNAVAAICGRHNRRVIWVVDEMPFMDPGILLGRLNIMANPEWGFWGLGNKPNEGDPLYQDAEPVGGWDSVDPNSDLGWETAKGGYCVYMDGERSPNMAAEEGQPAPFEGMMDRNMLEAIARDSGGTDSPGYWNQARGFPKTGTMVDTVLTKQLILDGKADREPVWSGERREVLAGLDLGFRADGDPCVIGFGGLGKNEQGMTILGLETPEPTLRLVTKVGSTDRFEVQIAKLTLDECVKRGCHHLELDVSGEGGIFSQAIAEEAKARNWQLTIYPTSFAGLPDENERFFHGGQLRPAKELFDKKVTQLWMSFRKSVMNGCIRGLHLKSRAVAQFCARKQLFDDKRKMSVESKKVMKKRIKRSPDDADALALLGSLALKRGLPREPQNARAAVTRADSPVEAPKARSPYAYGHGSRNPYARS